MLSSPEVHFTLSQFFLFFYFFIIASLLETSDLSAAFPLSYSLSCLSQSHLLSLLGIISHTSTFKVAAGGSPSPSQAPCCSRLHARPTVLLCLAHLHWDRRLFIIPTFKSLPFPSSSPPPLLLHVLLFLLLLILLLLLLAPTAVRLCSSTAGSTVISLIFTLPLVCFFLFVLFFDLTAKFGT